MRSTSRLHELALLALLLPACQDAAESAPIDAGTDATADVSESLATRVAVRLSRCAGVESGCHGSGAGGLTLGTADDFAAVIGVRSTERPDLYRIDPTSADRSWLVLKLENATDAGVETAMPLGSTGDPAFAAQLRAWIDAGAKADAP